ncbi:LamG-like jellyroll fold domain-containing protein [Haloferula sargassicola]|uniref:LamG-like jellyroll fold domain-containing protein n=1 Tax=Haloferula sargassicola TaxID=490096 RepID=A0ABP9USQ1_9BACT
MKRILLSVGAALMAGPASAAVFHVDASVATPGDGLTWAAAMTDLQAAISASSSGDSIWVAEGTYKPGTARSDRFVLPPGVQILGGFPSGGGDGTANARNLDPLTNGTVLSGDIDGDGTRAGNSYVLVDALSSGTSSFLSGFTLTGGNADGATTPTDRGGAISIGDRSPTLGNLRFLENRARYGGAIHANGGSQFIMRQCLFQGNVADIAGGSGGAIYLTNGASPTLTDCAFVGNDGIIGGAIRAFNSTPTLTHCTFAHNKGGSGDGALYNDGGTTVLYRNCIFWGNTPFAWNARSPAAGSGNNLVQGSSVDGSFTLLVSSPLFASIPFSTDGDWKTPADNDYGDLSLSPGSPAIDRGNNSFTSQLTDLAGNPRVADGDSNLVATVDLGAYEAPEPVPGDEIHRWTFDGDLKDSVGSLDLSLHGAQLRNGRLLLDGIEAYAASQRPLGLTLKERSLVAWVSPSSLNQAGGGVLTTVDPTSGTEVFDGIVFGERTTRQWMNGSNGFLRTPASNGGPAETLSSPDQVMIVITYAADNSIKIYRNGTLYGSTIQGSVMTYPNGLSTVYLGMRHPAGAPSSIYFTGSIDEARIYRTVLSETQVAQLFNEGPTPDTAGSAATNLAPTGITRMSHASPVALPDRTDAGVLIDGSRAALNRNAALPTVDEPNPWIEVELPQDALIERVVLTNIQFPLTGTCCSSRFRDITIELRDAEGNVFDSSVLLNPENTGYTAPNGPDTLSYQFDSDIPARIVRVTRTPDPDLSGSGGLGQPIAHEAGYLEFAEIEILGENVAPPPPVPAFSIHYDSRRSNPDPRSQGWIASETVVGSDVSPNNGSIDSGSNAGMVINGFEAAWQTHDQLTSTSSDNPIYRKALTRDHLRQMHDTGWKYLSTFRAVGGGGFLGWNFIAADNPGWDVGTHPGARVGFFLTRNIDDSLTIASESGSGITLPAGSASEYHTIRCVGQPQSTLFDWWVDDIPMGQLDLADVSHASLTSSEVIFGSGLSAPTGRVMNWKQAQLGSTAAPTEPDLSGLVFYLPFESGADGTQFLREKSLAPGDKPLIGEVNGTLSPAAPAVAGQGLQMPADNYFTGPSVYAKASPIPALAGLDHATVSVWLKAVTAGDGRAAGTLFSISGVPGDSLALRIVNPTSTPKLEFVNFAQSSTRPTYLLPDSFFDGSWHHVALTFSPGVTKLFVDGLLIDTQTIRFTVPIDGIDTLAIGAHHTADGPVVAGGFSGCLDEFAIWKRTLSDAEIENLYRFSYLGATAIVDRDGDGLNQIEEAAFTSSDENPDTDGDGIPDTQEAVLRTNPNAADSDGDGLDDDIELAQGSDPRLADSDGDGFNDNADPAPLDATVFPDTTSPDIDADGLTDAQETELNTNPALADSDDDGFDDFAEILAGTDPNDPASKPVILDSDGDGLTDAQEAALHTNPAVADSDNDTYSDHAEVNAGSNPNDDGSFPDTALLTTESFLRAENGAITLTFGVQGAATNHRLQSSDTLDGFTTETGAVITPLGGNRFSATLTSGGSRRFFRIAADSAGAEVVTPLADLDLPGGSTLTIGEGRTIYQNIVFTAPFTGYVSYRISGSTPIPGVGPLPSMTLAIAVENASSAAIPLTFVNDLIAGPSARYTVTLLSNGGLIPGLNNRFTVLVADDDQIWEGTLGTQDEQLNFTLESLTDGTTTLQQLHAANASSLIPQGTFPVTASFGTTVFSCTSGNIPLTRNLSQITAAPATISQLVLSATDGQGNESVTASSISGSATIGLAPPNGTGATLDATFNLQLRPPPPPSTDIELQTTGP